jgi:hypothetical protein
MLATIITDQLLMSLHCPACLFAREDGGEHKYATGNHKDQRQPRCYPAKDVRRARGFSRCWHVCGPGRIGHGAT